MRKTVRCDEQRNEKHAAAMPHRSAQLGHARQRRRQLGGRQEAHQRLIGSAIAKLK
jgi:hypothetical protein